jgi:hypothetical protein
VVGCGVTVTEITVTLTTGAGVVVAALFPQAANNMALIKPINKLCFMILLD